MLQRKKENDKIMMERKIKDARDRFMYLNADVSHAKLAPSKSNIWVDKLKKQVINMKNQDLMQENESNPLDVIPQAEEQGKNLE